MLNYKYIIRNSCIVNHKYILDNNYILKYGITIECSIETPDPMAF